MAKMKSEIEDQILRKNKNLDRIYQSEHQPSDPRFDEDGGQNARYFINKKYNDEDK